MCNPVTGLNETRTFPQLVTNDFKKFRERMNR